MLFNGYDTVPTYLDKLHHHWDYQYHIADLFPTVMQVCHLLVIWGSTANPMIRHFHFLWNLGL